MAEYAIEMMTRSLLHVSQDLEENFVILTQPLEIQYPNLGSTTETTAGTFFVEYCQGSCPGGETG